MRSARLQAPVFWSSDRVTTTPVLLGQGQEDEIQDPRARAEQGIWRPVVLLHSGEPSLCRTHTPALPLSEISEQSGGDVPVHLLPGAGVPPDHNRVPAQRVQGEGRPRGPVGGPEGRSDPCRHPGVAGFTRTACPLPFWRLRVCFPGCLGFSCSPLPHQPSSQVPIALPPPCASSHDGPLLGPQQAGACLPSWGSHTGLLQHLPVSGSRVGEDGLLSCSCHLVTLNDLSGPQAGLERREALITYRSQEEGVLEDEVALTCPLRGASGQHPGTWE